MKTIKGNHFRQGGVRGQQEEKSCEGRGRERGWQVSVLGAGLCERKGWGGMMEGSGKGREGGAEEGAGATQCLKGKREGARKAAGGSGGDNSCVRGRVKKSMHWGARAKNVG